MSHVKLTSNLSLYPHSKMCNVYENKHDEKGERKNIPKWAGNLSAIKT